MSAKIIKNRKDSAIHRVFLINELCRTMDYGTRSELWPRMYEAVKGGDYYECVGILAEYGLEPDYLNIWL